MGSAAVAAAAKRGLKTIGIEQFEAGHDLGASSGRTRMIRKAYYEHPSYVPLVLRAYDGWRELERYTGERLLFLTGNLIVGDERSTVLTGSRESARAFGLDCEHLTPAQCAARFPMFRLADDESALYERDGGLLLPERAVAALQTAADWAGAELLFRARVSNWSAKPNGVRLELDDGSTLEAARVALCAGPWLASIAGELGAGLVVQRNVQHWFEPTEPGLGIGECPAFFVDRSDRQCRLYGFPDAGFGVKAAFHGYGEATTADALDREVHPYDAEPVWQALKAFAPGAAGRYLGGKVCMYTMTPDGHFALGIHPREPRVVVAGGFSGHGFKFAPVVGEIVCDLAADGSTAYDVEFLSLKRFTGGVIRG